MSAGFTLTGASVRLDSRTVLDGVSLSVGPGEVLGVLGPNGGGKTTLLRAVLGLVRLAGGEARLGERRVQDLGEAERAALAAYLPQDRRVGWNLPAWRIAALGLPHRAPSQVKGAALAALADVGMEHLAERGVLDMSGGERARVLLARLIATGAPLLVADEPAAGLDPEAQFQVMAVLRARADRGAAVAVSLHDLTLSARSCDRVAVLASGRLAALGPPESALSPEVLKKVFGLQGRLIPTEFGSVVAARRDF